MVQQLPSLVSTVREILKQQLGSQLKALYLFGSATMGQLRPTSDVDLLGLIDGEIEPSAREALLLRLMSVSSCKDSSGRKNRPVELLLFQRASFDAGLSPPVCEFRYGEWLRSEYESGSVPGPVASHDFSILLRQARDSCLVLLGDSAADALPVISDEALRRAVLDSLEELLGNLRGDERNVILTLARMWWTIERGGVTTKDGAAEWAMARSSARVASALEIARDAYRGTRGRFDVDDSMALDVADALAHSIRGAAATRVRGVY